MFIVHSCGVGDKELTENIGTASLLESVGQDFIEERRHLSLKEPMTVKETLRALDNSF